MEGGPGGMCWQRNKFQTFLNKFRHLLKLKINIGIYGIDGGDGTNKVIEEDYLPTFCILLVKCSIQIKFTINVKGDLELLHRDFSQIMSR